MSDTSRDEFDGPLLHSILDKLLKDKPLVSTEYDSFEKFVREKLRNDLARRQELSRILEENEDERSVGSFRTDDEDEIGANISATVEQLEELEISSMPKKEPNEAIRENNENHVHPNAQEQEEREESFDFDANSSSQSESTSDISRVEFGSFVTNENQFLKFHRTPLPCADDLRPERIGYPISVTFDEIREEWYVCDKNESKVIRIRTFGGQYNLDVIDIQKEFMKCPSAVCIHKKGKSIAVLCGEYKPSIVIIETNIVQIHVLIDNNMGDFKMNFPLRGLCKTFGENFASLESTKTSKNLRVFKDRIGAYSYQVKEAVQPCFIASFEDKVAISDLGRNSVYLIRLDDSNWGDIRCQTLRIINSPENASIRDLSDNAGFGFVAGLQFDKNGYILIGDAKGQCIKLFGQELQFLHRVSNDFKMPYMSSFFVNSSGKTMILNIKSGTDKLVFAQLGNCKEVEPWNPVSAFIHTGGNNYQQNRNRQAPPHRQNFRA